MSYPRICSLALLCLPAALLLWCGGCGVASSDGEEDLDTAPPAQITDLAVCSYTDTSVGLIWTAPGDDGVEGTAAEYDLRYGEMPMFGDDWDTAIRAEDEPVPGPAGTREEMTVGGLTPEKTYCFVMTAYDELDNSPGLSNFVTATCFVDAPVAIPDPNLEAVLRDRLGKPTGELMKSDLRSLPDIGAESAGISDLTGLEECRNLNHVNFWNNDIDDLQPLAGLVKLIGLTVNENEIVDISPVAGLVELHSLRIADNLVADISAAAGLSGLEILWIDGNAAVTDISALSGLTGLTELRMGRTGITDLSALAGMVGMRFLRAENVAADSFAPLAGMTLLEELNLSGCGLADIAMLEGMEQLHMLLLYSNSISDLSPLVANPGLGEGDEVWLYGNPLSAESVNVHIPALEARGVTVHWN